MKLKHLVFFSLSVFTILIACKKEGGETTFRVRLTDAPAAYEEVNVDLQQVNVKFAHDTASWVSMKTIPGVYNLLGLQNGVDTLIAEETYPHSSVQEIRLVLGSNNTIKVGGQSYPLTIPSGSESGLKIKVNKSLTAPIESLIIDFDAALSVSEEQSEYKLRPVLKIK